MFFEPIYTRQALNTGTCLWQGDLFYSAGLHRIHVFATANTGEIGRGLEKIQVNGPEGLEISKEEIPGSKPNTYSYILTYSWL